jgi:hypothetical protein
MSQIHGSQSLVTFKVNDSTIAAYRLLAPAAGNNSVALWKTATSIMFAVSQAESKGATGTSVLAAIAGCALLTAGASVSAGAVITGQTATGLGIESALNTVAGASLTAGSVPFAIGVGLEAADTNSTFEIVIQPRLIRVTAAT